MAGIVNNVPGFVMAMGGTMGLAAALNITMVAVNQLVKHWPEFVALFSEGNNPVPEATRSAKGLSAAIDETNKELEKLADRTSLSNAELIKFNELTAETKRLELEVAKQREDEKLKQAKGADVDAQINAIQAAVNKVGYKEAVQTIYDQLKAANPSFGHDRLSQQSQDLLSRGKLGDPFATDFLSQMFSNKDDSEFARELNDPGMKNRDKRLAEAAERPESRQQGSSGQSRC